MKQKTLKSYLELTKPGITKLVIITTLIGYCMAAGGIGDLAILSITLIGTAMSCAGSCVLNNYLEKDYDPLMKRTASRALPKGEVKPASALAFGILLVLSGTVLLVSLVNLLTGFLALLTAFLYVLVYTPLKRMTWLNTFIGAIPGAIPPLGGWAAATGKLELGGWLLFLIMFFWQMPHFYSIAWMYKDDYKAAGFKMLSVDDNNGFQTFFQIVLFTLILVLASFMPVVLDNIGFIYVVSAGALGLAFLSYSLAGYFSRTRQSARALLHTSIIYLPLLFVSLLLDSFI